MRAVRTALILAAILLMTALPAQAAHQVLIGGEVRQFDHRPVIVQENGLKLISSQLVRAIWEGDEDRGLMGETQYRFNTAGDLTSRGRTVARAEQIDGRSYLHATPFSIEGINIEFDPRIGGWRIVGTLRSVDFGERGLEMVAVGPLTMRKIPGGRGGDLAVQIPGVRPAPELFTPAASSDGTSMEITYREADRTTLLTFNLPADRNISFYRSGNGRMARIDLQKHMQLADYRKGSAGSAIFTLGLGENPDYKVFRLEDPYRLVFDFPGVLHKGETRHEDLDLESVREVRVGQFKRDPPVTRLVFETEKPLRYRIIKNSGGVFRVQLLDPARMRNEGLIVVDAGHGGSDPGATVSGAEEKTINLAVAKLVEKELTSAGYQVVQTRRSDRFVSLEDRAELANELAPVAFVSVHSNYYSKSGVQGLINFHHSSSAEGYRLARRIQSNTVEQTGAVDKGVRTANFYVLRETLVPAVLVETGFMTNPGELDRLLSPDYRAELATGIAAGVIDYIRSVEFNRAPKLENVSR